MKDSPSKLAAIRKAIAAADFRLTVHATEEMTADGISVDDLVNAILDEGAEMVEDYPDDPRGSSCLLAGKMLNGGYVHFVMSYAPTPVVVTAYRPDPKRWMDYRTRRSP